MFVQRMYIFQVWSVWSGRPQPPAPHTPHPQPGAAGAKEKHEIALYIQFDPALFPAFQVE
ncbi:hypothetical protein KDK_68730 [Dictyobacter kobayashii]|uniref:Uncharacterized protein n=1 Tax=Dictyobacter kobayashii TaxID=2014872 RepID=A0A402AVN0_9CHLR|nr:hypothetical protein KDK_68730 [Dictyobacter kobayashii]